MSLPVAASSGATIHSHEHKKGLDPQAPSGSTQNLFGSLLDSLEQVIGVQPASGPAAAAHAPASTAANAIGAAAKSVLSTVGGPLSFFA